MLSDTVGFISDLPTQLVAAFRATLEEVLEADVILHVRDIAHEDTDAQQRDVDTVLRQLGIDPDAGQRILEVWNKIDRFDPESAKTCATSRRAVRPSGRASWSRPQPGRASRHCLVRSKIALRPRA